MIVLPYKQEVTRKYNERAGVIYPNRRKRRRERKKRRREGRKEGGREGGREGIHRHRDSTVRREGSLQGPWPATMT